MARKPRIYTEKGIYHVILRGNNKQDLFYCDQDRVFLLQRLKKYSTELNIEIYAYCLMTNHIHLLIGKASKTVSVLVQKLANSYVYYFNRKYERTGHLFQGRFKSEPINDDVYFKTVYRYILQNSENAGLGTFCEYKWNSYKYIVNSEHENIFCSDYILKLFGSKDQLIDFLSVKEKRKCMEFENKLVFPDEKISELIKKLFGIEFPYTLSKLCIDDQLQKMKILKNSGISINQISRVTGISKRIIKLA